MVFYPIGAGSGNILNPEPDNRPLDRGGAFDIPIARSYSYSKLYA